jgi:hypothetical protein
MRIGRAIMIVLGVALLGGCVSKAFSVSGTLERPRGGALRFLLMPLDVELSEITAGGLQLPKAEWTARATGHIRRVLTQEMGARRARLVDYAPPADDAATYSGHAQLFKLHEAVAMTIIRHGVHPEAQLPTKKDDFDWSLGPSVRELGKTFDADYALFFIFRDATASQERVAVTLLAAAMGGVLLSGGQAGIASLVDLRTGEMVWFSHLRRLGGDLRTLGGARLTLAALLKDFPQ